MFRLVAAVALACVLGTGHASAYEFWISPETFRCEPDADLRADIRIGEDFSGVPQAFSPDTFTRFEVLTADGARPVEGVPGDVPALSAAGLPEGLAVLVYETTTRRISWGVEERFMAFVRNKGLGHILEAQPERTEIRAGVNEEHVRYAKALVAVGHGRGDDSVVGLRTEFVALANPYTDDLAGALPVQLWLDGAPRRMAQVEVFARPVEGGDSTREVFETDSNGIVVLPVRRGMQYLVHSVALEPGDGSEGGADWRTLWASLTFEVPAPLPPS
jgi:hypothetical protein